MTTKEALEPCCDEWPAQSAIIDSYIKLQSARSGQDTFKLAGGVSFRFCPWCGKSRSGVPAPIVAPEVDDETKHDYAAGFLRAIAEGLRHAIRDHGPITSEWIGSASKRVYSRLKGTKYVK